MQRQIEIPPHKIEDIFLLSEKEAKELPTWVLKNDAWWWLRSPGFHNTHAAFVFADGDVSKFGTNVSNVNGAVCPALKIQNLDQLKLTIGDKISCIDKTWIYIGDNKVLLDGFLTRMTFNSSGNNEYLGSDVQNYILDFLADYPVHQYTLTLYDEKNLPFDVTFYDDKENLITSLSEKTNQDSFEYAEVYNFNKNKEVKLSIEDLKE